MRPAVVERLAELLETWLTTGSDGARSEFDLLAAASRPDEVRAARDRVLAVGRAVLAEYAEQRAAEVDLDDWAWCYLQGIRW